MVASHRPARCREGPQAYAKHDLKAVVHPFLARDGSGVGRGDGVCQPGGSFVVGGDSRRLRLPALLVPFPAAADNHQWHNARAFEETGAAQLLEQKDATPEKVCALLRELMDDPAERATIKASLPVARAQGGGADRRKDIAVGSSSRGDAGTFEPPPSRAAKTTNRAPLESAPVA
jgi:hypothetical protein